MANYTLQSAGFEFGRFGQVALKMFVSFYAPDLSTEGVKKKVRKPIRLNVTKSKFLAYKYNIMPWVQLDFNPINATTWSKDQSCTLAGFQVGSLIKFLNKTLSMIEDPKNEIFYYDKDRNDKLSIYGNYNSGKPVIKKVVGSHIMGSLPTIVEDYQDNLYEGAAIIIDKKERRFDITHTELEHLCYVVEKTDFYNMALSLFISTVPWGDKNVTKLLDIGIWQDTDSMERKDMTEYSRTQRFVEQQPPNSGMKNVFKDLVTKEG